MFPVASSYNSKPSNSNIRDISPILGSIRKPKPIKGPSDHPHERENPSLTGWSNINSPNVSGMALEAFQSSHLALVSHHLNEANTKNNGENQKKEGEQEPSSPNEQKPKFWLDSLKEKSYDEILRGYPKSNKDGIASNPKAPMMSRTGTLLPPQKLAAFNNILHLYHSSRNTESPLSLPGSPILNHISGKEGNSLKPSTQASKGSNGKSSPNEPANRSNNHDDFKIFRMPKAGTNMRNNPEKRSETSLKQRAKETLYIPTTVLSGSKLIKQENPKRNKNLKLSKALCLWSQVVSPHMNKSVLLNDPVGLKYSEPLSIDSPGATNKPPLQSLRTPGGSLKTKVYNFMGGKSEADLGEVKKLVPLPQFKPTLKVRRPVEEDKMDHEICPSPSRYETVRLRMTRTISLYTKDWDTANGFKRATSINTEKSETRRRTMNENSRDDSKTSDLSTKRERKDGTEKGGSGKQVSKRVLEKISSMILKNHKQGEKTEKGDSPSLEKIIEAKKPKKPEEVNRDGRMEVGGKTIKRGGNNLRATSIEMTRGMKTNSFSKLDVVGKAADMTADSTRQNSIQNFRLFEIKL